MEITNKRRRNAAEIAEDIIDPVGAARREINRRKKIYVIVDTDFSMREKRNAYEDATRNAEGWLRGLAEETGGLVFIPRAREEMIPRADEIAREIDSQYVVTYTQDDRWRRRPSKSIAESMLPPE